MSTPTAEHYLRTEFLRALAHAIRSPLGVVEGVLRELQEGEPEAQPMLLAMAERNLARLTLLGERLDWVAELEQGTHNVNLEVCDVARTVEEVLEQLEASRDKVEVAFERGRGVLADRTWLRRSLLLVLENALRFARARVVVSLEADGDARQAIVVTDDGPGIQDSNLEGLFDRYRSGRARGADHDLALGLSLARDYMRAMEGELSIDASRGGTRCRMSVASNPRAVGTP